MGRSRRDERLDVTAAEARVERPHRRRVTGRRLVSSGVATAAELVGHLEDGDEVSGLTNGQWSLIDLLEHVLSETGPAHVAVSTWTMGIYDQAQAFRFYQETRALSWRWLLDPSMFSRRPELAGTMVERFGVASFRAVNVHAKFATVTGGRLDVCVRSSMNLNPNKRLEAFDVSCDRALAAYYLRFVDDVFARVRETRDGAVTQSRAFFQGILAALETHREASESMPGAARSSLREMGAELQPWAWVD